MIGYRTTSNDLNVRYFHHQACVYAGFNTAHPAGLVGFFTGPFSPCRRYTNKLDAKKEDWYQCQSHLDPRNGKGINAGIDCWYACAKIVGPKGIFKDIFQTVFTNVVATRRKPDISEDTTSRRIDRSTGITDNKEGKETSLGYTDYSGRQRVYTAGIEYREGDVLLWVR